MFKPKFLFLLSPTSCFTTIPFIEGLGFKSEDELQTWLPCELVESIEDDNVEEVNAGEKSDDDGGGLVYELVTSCTCLGFVFEMLLSPSPNLFNFDFPRLFLFLFALVLLIIFLPYKNIINIINIIFCHGLSMINFGLCKFQFVGIGHMNLRGKKKKNDRMEM